MDTSDFTPWVITFLTTFFIAYTIIISAIIVFRIVCLWFIFKKAGVEPWKSLIPFYNTYTMFEISGFNGWFFLFLIIPFVSAVFSILQIINLGSSFRKSSGFIVGMILLPEIFYAILAFSHDRYINDQVLYFTKVKVQ